MAHRLWLKLIGISAFMWLFFLGYFHVLRNPSAPPTPMPTTPIDDWIVFQPGLLGAYISLWVYLGIAPGLLLGLRALIVYGLWAAALCAVGLACFYWWPTSVQPVSVDLQAHPGFAVLQGVDSTGNACPSLHVATAAFTAVWIDHLVRHIGAPGALRALNVAWFVLIAYSTLAIKQHVLLDAVAGLALGLAVAALSLRWRAAESPSKRSAYHSAP
ncbi:MAG TPA: phosphatase PAP2 family protein [Methylibium sp.]|uniref:phosphatase PAP2 family protein n=1 Tax=Methylibium sp. TaxID=2067992 RepID=UPI002DBE4544|nr:phosphatase PAP2 family protein [Methylibium sp.]HEU4459153.1 phosphatase PAP2 family protein [Methylibium sp.]